MVSRERHDDSRRARARASTAAAAKSIYLPNADPPQKRPLQLAIAAMLLGAWLLFLLYMALQ